MSYQLSRLDLVVNNATTQITVNTNPSTQSYIGGEVTPQDNIIDVASTNNRFTNPDDYPAATILSTSKAASLTNLTVTDTGTFNMSVSSPVEGNGLGNNLNINYDGGTYTQLLTAVGVNSTSTTIEDLSDNKYIIVNSGVTVSSAKPTAISGAAYSYNSLVFAGGQYLNISDCTSTIFNEDDFTIEFFMLATNANNNTIISTDASPTGTSFKVRLDVTTNTISFIYRSSSLITITSTASITLGSWSHVALVKRDTGLTNNFTFYIDGIASGSFSITDTIGVNTPTGINIGLNIGGGFGYIGSLSNIRIVKGLAVYTGNFTVPSANLTKTQQSVSANVATIASGYRINTKTVSTTKLPLYVPRSIIIYNSLKYTAPTGQIEVYEKPLTVNSYTTAATTNINVISSTKIMNVADRPDFYITGSDAPNILGISSSTITNSLGGNFNGTSSNLTVTATNAGPLDLSTTSSWTIEGWFYPTSVTGSRSVFWKGGGSPNNPSYAMWLNGATPQWIVGDGFTGGIVQDLSAITINTWYHFALVRKGEFVTAYINGVAGTPVAITSSGPTANSTLWIGAAVDGRYFSGYISNFRLVKGIAVYTNNFAVLPQISLLLTTPNNTDYYKNSSIYNLTVTKTGSSSSSIAPTWGSGASGSLRFNGSEYLTIPGPNSGVLDLSQNAVDWTVECWFRKDDITTDGAIFWKDGTSGSINPSYALWIQGGIGVEGRPQWIVGDGVTGNAPAFRNMSNTIVANTWYHFALVRSGNVITAYLNGSADTSAALSSTMGQQNANLTIGATVDPAFRYGFGGYISNFRIVKGSALYTSNFTVPTSPFTLPTLPTATLNTTINSITGTQTSLLLSTTNDGNYLKDSSANNFTVINNGGVVSSSIGPTWSSGSTSSLAFNGTSQYLSTANNSAFDFGLDDFTVECYFYLRSVQGNNPQNLILLRSNLNQCLQLFVKPGSIYASILTDAGYQSISNSSSNVSLDNWYHIAYVRNGSNHYLYLNGVQAAYKVYSPSSIITSTSGLTIGAYDAGTSQLYFVDGYISNVRLVKGKAVYTSSFIPPNMPLTTTQNASTAAYSSSLLTLQNANIADNSQFANAMTPVAVSTTIPYSTFLNSFSYNTPGAVVSTPSTPAYIRNTTKYNDPTEVGGYFSSFIPEHTGEEDRVQAWI